MRCNADAPRQQSSTSMVADISQILSPSRMPVTYKMCQQSYGGSGAIISSAPHSLVYVLNDGDEYNAQITWQPLITCRPNGEPVAEIQWGKGNFENLRVTTYIPIFRNAPVGQPVAVSFAAQGATRGSILNSRYVD